MIIKPKALKKGDRIALLDPSSPVREREQIKKAENVVKEMGFEPVMYPSCTAIHGYLAGTDEVRARDINDAFSNKEIDGIICLRGGYGTPRILPLLDYDLIKKNPKVFIGYSDITGLHMAINRYCRMVTFHGPTGTSDCFMKGEIDSYTKESFEKNLYGVDPIGKIENPIGQTIQVINGGKAEGEIIGGNLSLLVSTLGSPYEIDIKDKILFIEEVGEYFYKVDRMLTSLALAGKFEQCKGIILGTWKNCKKEYEEYSLDFDTLVNEIIKPYGKPTINNFRAGHIYPQITIPFGTNVRLDADKKEVTFLENACI